MPEIPDLEAVAGFLRPRLRAQPLTAVEARLPWLVRTGADALQDLVGHRFVDVSRRGKFLHFVVDDGRVLVMNAMLTGRFQWAEAGERLRPLTALVFSFAGGQQLRYSDQRRMGRWYLVAGDALDGVPGLGELGPDALEVDEETFLERLRRHRGQIKHTLTNQAFLAGIGNAYSDEILWEAQIHPHRTGSSLSDEERHRLFAAMRTVYDWALPLLAAEVAERLYQRNEEWRAHLRAHRRGGEPCPRCGEALHSQVRSGRETNYCLRCQPLAMGAGEGGIPRRTPRQRG